MRIGRDGYVCALATPQISAKANAATYL